MSAPFRLPWRTIFIVLLTIGLLWYSFRNVDLAGAWQATKSAHPGLLLASLAFTIVIYPIRARRWQVILEPLGRARFRTSLRATVIGFTATFLLWGRVGELLRAYLIAKQDGFKTSAAFATVVVERIFDLSTTLLLFACFLPFVGVDVGRNVKWTGAAGAALAVASLVAAYIFAGHPDRLANLAATLTRRLPPRIATGITNVVRTFIEGLAVMRSPRRLLLTALWSIPLWTSITISIWLCSLAFDLTVPFPGAFLVMIYLVVGVSAPTPGGVGAFEFMFIIATTTFFGASPDSAAAAAIVLHLISIVPVCFLGLLFMWQDGLTLGGVKEIRDEAKGTNQ